MDGWIFRQPTGSRLKIRTFKTDKSFQFGKTSLHNSRHDNCRHDSDCIFWHFLQPNRVLLFPAPRGSISLSSTTRAWLRHVSHSTTSTLWNLPTSQTFQLFASPPLFVSFPPEMGSHFHCHPSVFHPSCSLGAHPEHWHHSSWVGL